jgi:hypothetical protein
MTQRIFSLKVFNMGIKNTEFYADFKLKEVFKRAHKSYMQICMQILSFSVFTSF